MNQLKSVEKKISNWENNLSDLEKKLFDITDSGELILAQDQIASIKIKIDKAYKEWDELSSQLELIN
mgnify:CR=1 FL=1